MISDDEDYDFEEPQASISTLRDYQVDCIEAVERDWADNNRLLIAMATGLGKTVIFSTIAKREVERGGKVLILAHTDELIEQARDKLLRSTGLQSDREKASDMASPNAHIVVASVQTLSRINRLTGFRPDHFALVIVDEAHRSLAPTYQRIMRYFHFGKPSLDETWQMPEPGVPYGFGARILGVTATPDRGDKRSLGEFFQKISYEHTLIEACREGWLVKPIVRNIPIKIDLRGVRTSRLSGQTDFAVADLAERIAPFLRVIADAIFTEARGLKTVCFLPSIETARLLSEALVDRGMAASFVSGYCTDRSEKIAAFEAAGTGTVICNAMLLTEGWDCPTASCICVLRPTKIRALFSQCIGRATRTLPGLIDGLPGPQERLAAIATSAKPSMLILDFLWLTDRLDLVKPIDLVTTKPEIKKKMEESENGDLVEAEAAAGRDLLKSLEAAAKRNSKKQARTIDPLAWAVSLGDTALAGWEPETQWDTLKPTPGQIELLQRQGIDCTNITARGLASKIIDRVMSRYKLKLCTPKQLTFMTRLGIPEQVAALMTMEQASRAISAKKNAA